MVLSSKIEDDAGERSPDISVRQVTKEAHENPVRLLLNESCRHLPHWKPKIRYPAYRPRIIISEELYHHLITEHPVEGLILKTLIEQGDYQISSSGRVNSLE